MSTTYTGNNSATQAPSDPPVDGTAPKATLPADGDALIAASVAQPLKRSADFETFEQAPFANASQWGQVVRPYKSAAGVIGSYMDHMGIINGRYFDWVEYWQAVSGVNPSWGPGTTSVGRWTWNTNSGSAGGVSIQGPGISAGLNPWNTTKAANLTLDGTAGSKYGQLQADPTTCFTTDSWASMDVDFELSNVLDVVWRIGFFGNGDTMAAMNNGIYLERPDTGGTNFKFNTVAAGTVGTPVDSGILAGAGSSHHLTVQYWGSGVSDDGAAHAVFILDGSVFHIEANLPNTAGAFKINPLAGGVTTGAGGATQMILGPIRYCQITPR